MARTVTDADEGKPVVTSNGEQIGQVAEVRDGTVHVTPEEGVADTVRSTLGWDDADQDDHVLQENHIDRVTDVEIRLTDGT